MKKIVLFALLFTLFACENSTSTQEVETAISELKTEEQPKPEQVEKLFTVVEKYSKANPKAEKTPEYLELVAKYHTVLGNNEKAIAIYDNLFENYKQYKGNADALFMKAFILENNMYKKNQAKAVYQQYINLFPQGDFARDAQFAIDNMDKTPEELMEMLKQRSLEKE